MYNLTEEEKQKIHTALICASDSGTLDEFTKEELSLINEAESIVNKLTIPVVVVPKGTLPNNCKVCGRTIEEMGKMTSMCGVSACPNYQAMHYNCKEYEQWGMLQAIRKS